MCLDPVSATVIAGVGMAATAVGSGVQAYSNYTAGQAQKKAMEYRAVISEKQGNDAIYRGNVEEQKVRRETAQLTGRQRSLMAAGNVDLGSGSPLAILADTAQFGEVDAQTVRFNARREKEYYQEETRLSLLSGNDAANAGRLNAFGSVLGGVAGVTSSFGTVADKWYKPSYGKQAKPYGNW